jgi:hypothetical protein
MGSMPTLRRRNVRVAISLLPIERNVSAANLQKASRVLVPFPAARETWP